MNREVYSILYKHGRVVTLFVIAACGPALEDQAGDGPLEFVEHRANLDIPLANPGFEDGWNGWRDTDPSAISGVAYAGSRAAKLTGAGGRMEQTVAITPNTSYRLTARVNGTAEIGVIVGGAAFQAVGQYGSWSQASVSFESGSSNTAIIYGAFSGGEGRFDDFSLSSTENRGGSGGSVDRLSIQSASGPGSSPYLPMRAIDGDESPESRWSAQGIPQALTLDLGQVYTVQQVRIAWYRGDQRRSTFDVSVSAHGSAYTAVLSNE
ncbi:MAG: discoidin domain-containing protein, partial [Myxococcota bacterium]